MTLNTNTNANTMGQEIINIGDTVRSFDFGKDQPDCYIEGTVEDMGRLLDWQQCDVYKIKCTKKVFSGKTIEKHEEYYYPPVNGTPTWTGEECDYVSKVEPEVDDDIDPAGGYGLYSHI